jgi:hypothetical protein
MATILASFSTSNVADNIKMSNRASQGKTPTHMQAPEGQSIAGNLSASLPEADTLEVVDFNVSGTSDADNTTWVNAYGFTRPTNIEAKQVYLEVPDAEIEAYLEFLAPLIGLIWIDGDVEDGLTLKQVREVGSASDEEIAENSRLFKVGLKQELPNIVIGPLPIDSEEGETSVTEGEGKASVTSLYIMGFATLGILYYAYKKSTDH